MNLFSILTSPLEKGLAVAVGLLLTTSCLEALVIKYEIHSKANCVEAVKSTNLVTKTVTTAIRNVDNASNQTLQTSVTDRIARDVAGLHNSTGRTTGQSMPGVSGGISSPSTDNSTTDLSTRFYTDEAGAKACLVAVDIAEGWQQWYTQTELNWKNVENLNGSTKSSSNGGGSGVSKEMENLRVSFAGPIRIGVGLGKEDVRQEQPLRDEGDYVPTSDRSSNP